MKKFYKIFPVVCLVSFTRLCELPPTSGGFPLVFPFLTTGWYYKPGPAESVVLGLLLVKVLALRLGSATGVIPIPYHLNDLFARRIYKRSVSYNFEHFHQGNRTNYTEIPVFPHSLTTEELRVVQRILLGLRRIDSNDCFIRFLCQMNQDLRSGYGSEEDEDILRIFRINPGPTSNSSDNSSWSIWNVYQQAIRPEETNCTLKYPSCPLKDFELEYDSLMTGLF